MCLIDLSSRNPPLDLPLIVVLFVWSLQIHTPALLRLPKDLLRACRQYHMRLDWPEILEPDC